VIVSAVIMTGMMVAFYLGRLSVGSGRTEFERLRAINDVKRRVEQNSLQLESLRALERDVSRMIATERDRALRVAADDAAPGRKAKSWRLN